MVHWGQKLVWSKVLGISFIWVWEFSWFWFLANLWPREVGKSAIFSIFAIFSKFRVQKSAKNENHENSHTQMKIMPNILLQTNF